MKDEDIKSRFLHHIHILQHGRIGSQSHTSANSKMVGKRREPPHWQRSQGSVGRETEVDNQRLCSKIEDISRVNGIIQYQTKRNSRYAKHGTRLEATYEQKRIISLRLCVDAFRTIAKNHFGT